MTAHTWLWPFLALATLSPPAPSEPAESLYRTGIRLLESGRREEALEKIEAALASAPRGEFVAEARLAAARLNYPVEGWEGVGQATAEGVVRARSHLEAFLAASRDSPGTPEALYRRGLIQMDPLNSESDLRAAHDTFRQLVSRYPRSPRAAEALDAAAQVSLLRGMRAVSAGEDIRLQVEHGATAAARRARVRLAGSAAVLGEIAWGRRILEPALGEESGRGARRADSRARSAARQEAVSADARARALDRLLARAEDDGLDLPPPRQHDTAYGSGPESGAVEGMIGGSTEGMIWVLDGDTGRVVSSDGRVVAARAEGQGKPRGFARDGRGEVYLWDDRGITLPDQSRFEPRVAGGRDGSGSPVRKIQGIALGPLGEIDVLDGAEDRLLRFGADRQPKGVLATFEGRPTGLIRAGDGTLYVLVPSRRQIVEVTTRGDRVGSAHDPDARARRLDLRGPGGEVPTPTALAVDTLGRLYVLDAPARAAMIFDGKGRWIGTIAPPRGAEDEWRSPAAIAVDGAGQVYIGDRRRGRILRYR